ncbi:hypothetical protein LY90DRAFT_515342 [Neocallimastix californiae]|uniref:Uncharacterized protein n=1 Tax=Neocallimastix californiae TaxID=1754190 RepID=A0A1Y2AJR8_9FUNG|nr:hypothetical protein LY90DRAFT_515342 [Neocallimastix californiae]|eukprot:ORY22813.1 hypothetical protein LY90DRAFT_515342 [Neocallimastix californiae]
MYTYDENDNFVERYDLTFNNETHHFNEYTSLFFLQKVKYIILYNNEDIDKKEEDINTLVFWNVSTLSLFYSVAMYINVFPYWYSHLKKKNETFRLRIDSVGWYDNANMDICKNNNKTPCPDLIILGTNQKTGKSFESLLNKYSYYECM